MKWGLRNPSLRKSIAARTSLKRYIRQSLGVKAPRGWGWLTNPKKAAYNRIYNRTTFNISDLFKTRRRSSAGCAEIEGNGPMRKLGCLGVVVILTLAIISLLQSN